jgi:hypothetical protein
MSNSLVSQGPYWSPAANVVIVLRFSQFALGTMIGSPKSVSRFCGPRTSSCPPYLFRLLIHLHLEAEIGTRNRVGIFRISIRPVHAP